MSSSERLPLISQSDCNPIPVFNCHVILSPTEDGSDRIRGRVANLADIEASGSSEREVLMAISRQFRKAVQQYTESSESIPWIDPPETAAAGESERFIPIHL
jgi:hypothetical protein